MRWWWAVGMLGGSGCLMIVPRTKVLEHVAERGVTPVIEGAAGPLAMTSEATGPRIHVALARSRDCSREVFELIDKRQGMSAQFIGEMPKDQIAAIVAAIASVVILPVSGLVTGLVVAVSKEHSWRDKRVVTTERWPCPVTGVGIAVELALPSGGRITGTTDSAGRVTLEVPATEPPTGTVSIHTEGVSPRGQRYYRDRAACTQERDELYAGARYAELPECAGGPGDADVERAWVFTRDALLASVRHDCRVVALIDSQVAQLSPELHARVFDTNADLAACKQEKRDPNPTRAACLQQRIEQQRRAQQTSDIKERTRLLTTLPECPP